MWQLDSNTGRRIAIFRNKALAGKAVGTNTNSIVNCIAGRSMTCGGYKWEKASKKDVETYLAVSLN